LNYFVVVAGGAGRGLPGRLGNGSQPGHVRHRKQPRGGKAHVNSHPQEEDTLPNKSENAEIEIGPDAAVVASEFERYFRQYPYFSEKYSSNDDTKQHGRPRLKRHKHHYLSSMK